MRLLTSPISIIAILLVGSASSCHDDVLSNGEPDPGCGKDNVPDWLQSIISSAEQNGNKG